MGRLRRAALLSGFCPATILLLFVCILTGPHALPAQSEPPSATGPSALIAKTELVVLPVSVTDSSGNFISGLSPQNFRVYENGRLQEITAFQDGDTPVTVGLIVDHSRSMGPKLREVAEAVSVLARSSNPQDEMFVVDFNDDVTVELLHGKPFTDDPDELAKAVSSVRARGRTALYDAVAEGLLHLQLGQWDKKALIIVSDGGDNASQHKYSHILALAQQSQVVIYSLGLADGDEEENPDVLRRLSKATGGIAFFPQSLPDVTDISRRVARDLREQYTLGFVPQTADSSDSFRQLTVKVSAPGRGKMRVRTRPGYFKHAHVAADSAKGAS
jgi:Ca-activated chloride channel family protein